MKNITLGTIFNNGTEEQKHDMATFARQWLLKGCHANSRNTITLRNIGDERLLKTLNRTWACSRMCVYNKKYIYTVGQYEPQERKYLREYVVKHCYDF